MGQLWLVCKRASRPGCEWFFRFRRRKNVFKLAEGRGLDWIRSAASGLRYLLQLHLRRVEGKLVLEPRRWFAVDGRHLYQVELQRRNDPVGRHPLEQPSDRRLLFPGTS